MTRLEWSAGRRTRMREATHPCHPERSAARSGAVQTRDLVCASQTRSRICACEGMSLLMGMMALLQGAR